MGLTSIHLTQNANKSNNNDILMSKLRFCFLFLGLFEVKCLLHRFSCNNMHSNVWIDSHLRVKRIYLKWYDEIRRQKRNWIKKYITFTEHKIQIFVYSLFTQLLKKWKKQNCVWLLIYLWSCKKLIVSFDCFNCNIKMVMNDDSFPHFSVFIFFLIFGF